MDDDNLIFPQEKSVRADALRNRRRLLETARRLFDEQGIEDVTMSAIAREANVGKGTLYRHFSDKADLCHALLDEAMRQFQQATLLRIRQNQAPLMVLRWFLRSTVEYVNENMDLLLEAANQGGVDMIGHPAHMWWRQTIRGLLERIQPEGDIDYMTDVLYIMLDVQTIRFQMVGQGYNRQRVIDGLWMTLARFVASSATYNQCDT